IILAVNGQEIPLGKDATTLLTKEIQTHPNQEIDLKIQHENQQTHLKITPKQGTDGKGVVGIELVANGKANYRRPQNITEILKVAATRFQQ
ncbi:MAG: RIP metalloprotease RseP, partial [Dolichospermum sp.]